MSDINWWDVGYSQGMRQMTGATTIPVYPYRDKHGEKAEQDYINGYNHATNDYNRFGYDVCKHYVEENDGNE